MTNTQTKTNRPGGLLLVMADGHVNAYARKPRIWRHFAIEKHADPIRAAEAWLGMVRDCRTHRGA